MTRIEKIAAQPDRAGRYTVKLENGAALRLYRQTVEDFGLYPGKELSPEEYIRAVEQVTARQVQQAAKAFSLNTVYFLKGVQ